MCRASEVARGKPEPDLFLYAAGQVGLPPGRYWCS
jgi:beta-phosphoglucomutase-like phosphatase (HAD superfamily)